MIKGRRIKFEDELDTDADTTNIMTDNTDNTTSVHTKTMRTSHSTRHSISIDPSIYLLAAEFF